MNEHGGFVPRSGSSSAPRSRDRAPIVCRYECPALQQLTVRDTSVRPCALVELMECAAKTLTSLDASYPSDRWATGKESLFAQPQGAAGSATTLAVPFMPVLRRLDLSATDVSDADILALLPECPQLEQLVVGRCRLQHCVVRSPSLQHLDAPRCSRLLTLRLECLACRRGIQRSCSPLPGGSLVLGKPVC